MTREPLLHDQIYPMIETFPATPTPQNQNANHDMVLKYKCPECRLLYATNECLIHHLKAKHNEIWTINYRHLTPSEFQPTVYSVTRRTRAIRAEKPATDSSKKGSHKRKVSLIDEPGNTIGTTPRTASKKSRHVQTTHKRLAPAQAQITSDDNYVLYGSEVSDEDTEGTWGIYYAGCKKIKAFEQQNAAAATAAEAELYALAGS